MKIKYYTVTLNFNEDTGWLNLEGSGISIEFKINDEERNKMLNYLEEIKRTEDIILNPIPIGVTERLLQQGILDSTEKEYLEYFWKMVNEVYLGPYRVLLNHAGDTEKQRKALRDFFRPIRFRLRSVQTVMEAENNITINTQLNEIL
jgi:hypothetical protein